MTTLEALHERLARHFQLLRQTRDVQTGGRPVFALEHGLMDQEVGELKAAVHSATRSGQLSSKWWLPLVVYASEVGYRYTGHEYWQTFEAETPEWIERGDRQDVRDQFQQFAKQFNGAQPSGPWARQFSIICWPITHAILPTDLQFQLARLLYETRQILPELLAQPDVLGAKLAARAIGSSTRFENFAQNHDLLGQVAAALVQGPDSSTPLLLDSALRRIVADLSVERQARRWLQDARRSAIRAKIKGAAGVRHRIGMGPRSVEDRLHGPQIATFSLRRKDGAPWSAFLEVPDLSSLTEASPDLYRKLASSRCRVAGVNGPPLAPGRILYPGQVVRLDEWPDPDSQLLQLETPDSRVDAILADECAISSGPVWLFLQNDEQSADEVLSKAVHADRRYILATREFGAPFAEWIKPVPIGCPGVFAFELQTPAKIGANEEAVLRTLQLTVLSDIEIQPTGLVPAGWDGEGHVEWVMGDVPLLTISSTREIESCALLLDEEPMWRVRWPMPPLGDRMFISLGGLDIGTHVLQVYLVPRGAQSKAIEGTLNVVVREPRIRSSVGTYREPLVIASSPALPTLTELWEGDAAISILGPTGLPVDVRVTLERERGANLVSRSFPGLRLPVESPQFLSEFDAKVRRAKEVYRQYDYAMSCLIAVSNPELGYKFMRCERELAPLRWGVAEDHEGPYVRLHDNSGSVAFAIQHFLFNQPGQGRSMDVTSSGKYRSPSGGMFVARIPNFQTAVILPPAVRDLADLRRLDVQPQIMTRYRSVDSVLGLMANAELWASAQFPGTPFARIPRNRVMRALTIAIAKTIAGSAWADVEDRLERGDQAALGALGRSLGQNEYQKSLVGAEVRRNATALVAANELERVGTLERVIRMVAPNVPLPGGFNWMAHFLLRLASSPDQALAWSGVRPRSAVEAAIRWPIMFCAARYFVLSLHAASPDSGGKRVYEGWSWQ